MRVTVRLFARLREVAGVAECVCDLPDQASIGDVWQSMAARYPAIAPFGRSVSSALNADFARPHTEVHDGDEVAFLPPVSGG